MKPTDTRLQLAPPGERARWWLFLLVAVLPTAITAVSIAVRAIQRGSGGNPLALAFVAAAFLALWWLLRRLIHRQHLQASADTLDVRSSMYRCRVALPALDLARSRVLDLDEHPELRPALKTNGFSLPGYRSGWFRLRNTRRCFIATAGGARVLWLTSDAHDLLLEPRDPAALLARLRELATPGGRA